MINALILIFAAFIVFVLVRRITKSKSSHLPNSSGIKMDNLEKDIEPYDADISSKDGTPEIVTRLRNAYKGKPLRELNDLYFTLLNEIQEAERRNDFTRMLMHCQASLGLIEPLIKHTKKEYGRFDINGIPAIEKGLTYFAVSGNVGQLKNIADVVNYFKELDFFKDMVVEAFEVCDTASKIYKYVKENPNTKQTDLKEALNMEDGRHIATVVHYMERMKKVSKTKVKNRVYLTTNK